MRRIVLLVASVFGLLASVGSAQQEWRTAPLGTLPQAKPQGADNGPRPSGSRENRWRYRFFEGRWWYWTPDNRWSYFDGRRWMPFAKRASYARGPVDPAMLRLEFKEGALGQKKWRRVPGGSGGGSLPLTGTEGPLGGSPSGSFTVPGGVPSAINTETGTPRGVTGLNAAGRAGGR